MALQAFSVDRVTDQRSAQVMNPVNKMASTEDPRKRKILKNIFVFFLLQFFLINKQVFLFSQFLDN
jgi:hypothetical protein